MSKKDIESKFEELVEKAKGICFDHFKNLNDKIFSDINSSNLTNEEKFFLFITFLEKDIFTTIMTFAGLTDLPLEIIDNCLESIKKDCKEHFPKFKVINNIIENNQTIH